MKVGLGIIVFFLVSWGPFAHAESEKRLWDLGVIFGASVGSVGQVSPTNGNQTFGYGGVPVGILLSEDLSHRFTLQIGAHFIADVANIQITRTGLDVGLAFHLLGGARRLVEEFGSHEIISRAPYNFSLLVRTGFHQYSASDPTASETLKGSAFQVMGGAEYRFDGSDQNSYAVDLTTTLLSLSASSERLTASLAQLAFTWRFFL